MQIAATDAKGLALGLLAGLSLADARARVPRLAVAQAEPEADAAFLERLATACGRFTPLVALDPPHALLLDVTGCTGLFGGEEALLAEALTRLKRLGLSVEAGMADTPDAARAVARHGPGGIVPTGCCE